MTVQTYQNTVNYGTLASSIGSTYTSFNPILSNNVIVLFMTSMRIQGGTTDTGGPYYPLNLTIDATPMSTSTFKFFVTFSINSRLT